MSADCDKRTNQNDLRSLLIMPIQRLPRYCLLISDYASKLPDDLVDYDVIVLAQRRLKEVTAQINNKKREADRSMALVQISQKIKPTIPGQIVLVF